MLATCSSSAFRYGQHLISMSSATQVPISFSRGEAEFYSIVKTASRMIGLQQLLKDLGKPDTKGRLWTDAAAAKGIASRRGVGGARHLETPTPDFLGAGGDQGQEVLPAQREGRGQHRRPGDEARRDPDDVEAPQQDGALRRSRPQQAGTEGRPLKGTWYHEQEAPRGPPAGSTANAVAGRTALATPSGQHRYYSSGQHRTSLEAGSTASTDVGSTAPASGQHRHFGGQHRNGRGQYAPAGSSALTAGSTARRRVAPRRWMG